MKIAVENILEVVDFERYIGLLKISPTEGEKKWYTFVLTEVTLDDIVYGVLAKWIGMYCDKSFESIIEDLKDRTSRGVKVTDTSCKNDDFEDENAWNEADISLLFGD